MTNEILATLTQAEIDIITGLIKQGYGAQGICFETPFTLKQINAVFKLEAERNAPKKTYRLSFTRVETDYVRVTADNLLDAIAIAREAYPRDDWDFSNSTIENY